MLKVKVGAASLLAGMFMMFSGCSSETDCHEGDECACSGQGTCEWNCVDEGCSFDVSAQGTSTLTCDKGGCALNVTGQGDVNFDCAGGNCTVTNTGQGTVDLACSGGGCSMTCGGNGTCTTTECEDCMCEETEITAECSGE